MKKAEKNCKRYTGRKERHWCKRMAKRARRRQERVDPENAATRLRDLTRGWSD